jgi:hypothetical protein
VTVMAGSFVIVAIAIGDFMAPQDS